MSYDSYNVSIVPYRFCAAYSGGLGVSKDAPKSILQFKSKQPPLGDLKCILLNAHSIRNKVFKFDFEIIEEHDPDLVFLTETWLSTDDPDNLFICRHRYDIIRLDRTGRGGGVAILAKKELKCLEKNVQVLSEGIWIEILKPTRIIFGLFYNNDVRNTVGMNSCLSSIEHVTRQNNAVPIVVCGDFNQPDVDWHNLTAPSANNQDANLQRFLATGLQQKVFFPTFDRSNNTLDLVFESVDNLVTDVRQGVVSFGDHHPVLFSVKRERMQVRDDKFFPDYKRMEHGPMRLYLEYQNWNNIIGDPLTTTLDEMWTNFKSFYTYFCDIFIPKRNSSTQSGKPRYPKSLRKLKHKLKNARRKFDRSPTAANQTRINELSDALQTALRDYVSSGEMVVLKAGDNRSFFNFVRRRIGKTKVSPNIVSPESNEPIEDPVIKANVFNEHFKSVFKPREELPEIGEDDPLNTYIFTYVDVTKFIKQLSADAAPGPDNLHPVVLKSFAQQFAIPLTMIFNKAFNVSDIPQDWKTALVTPVYKGKGGNLFSKFYRPISLTSHCCKIMERVLKKWLLDYFVENNLISKCQHGFLSSKSTLTNLLSCLSDWVSALDEGDYVDVIYLDVAKAFDTVSHAKLLSALQMYGVPNSIVRWTRAFLTGRTQRVRVDGCLSDEVDVTSGVPQGSVLGPTLFTIFINGLPNVVRHCKVQIYADDTKLYLRFPRNMQPCDLQDDLDAVISWLDRWGLDVAAHKSFVVPLSLVGQRTTLDYRVNGASIPVVHDKVRDLGVLFSCNLNSSVHIQTAKSTANARVGLIFRCFKTRNVNFLVKVYKAYVRPLLEYCSPAWNSVKVQDIMAIESVQRLFTRRLCDTPGVSYPDRLKHFGLEPLELRRIRTDLVELYKIVKNKSGVCFNDVLQYANITGNRQKNNLRIAKKFCRTSFGLNSYYSRNVDIWNDLPQSIVDAPSVKNFRDKLIEYDLSKYLVCFPDHYL